MDHTELHSNISQVKSRISSAADAVNRVAGDIRLIAVSKTKPVEDVRAAFHAGISDFGENYVTEAVDKVHPMQRSGHYLAFSRPITIE